MEELANFGSKVVIKSWEKYTCKFRLVFEVWFCNWKKLVVITEDMGQSDESLGETRP